MAATDDLLIIASARADFFDVVQRIRADSVSVEVRLDRRRGERRRAADAAPRDERRRADRRSRDVSEELERVGWVFIPAAERSAS